MRTSPPIVRTILLVFMFLIALPPASIASAKTTTDEIVRETVRWTLTPDQCKDIRHRIDGTGERLQVITTTVKADGSREIIDNDIVTGTARELEGSIVSVCVYEPDDPAGAAAGGAHSRDYDR